MTNSKNTKRSLLASVLSVLLCVAMLIGSTFAWFTDSVTSGNNKIVAGNLDVELEYRDQTGTWKPVTETTKLFQEDALWEPGHTEVVYLKVKNAGTLALKYQLAVTAANETTFTNALGKTDCRLSDYLVFGQAENDTEIANYATREEAWEKAGYTLGLSDYTKEAVLYPAGTAGKLSEQYVALVVYMPTTVGNEANYRGDVIPSIDLGVNLVAAQTPYEEDGFGKDYDKGAASVQNMNAIKLEAQGYSAVNSLDDLEYELKTEDYNDYALISTSGKLFLNKDIQKGTPDWYFASKDPVTLDLNGYMHKDVVLTDGADLTITDSVGTGALYRVEAGQGTVTLENCKVNKVPSSFNLVRMVVYPGATMVINGGEYNPELISTQGEGATLIINDGNFLCDIFYIQNISGEGSIIVNGGTFKGDIGAKDGITLGEGKQCFDNGDGTWTVK